MAASKQSQKDFHCNGSPENIGILSLSRQVVALLLLGTVCDHKACRGCGMAFQDV